MIAYSNKTEETVQSMMPCKTVYADFYELLQCNYNAHAVHMHCTCNTHAMHMQCSYNANTMQLLCTCNAKTDKLDIWDKDRKRGKEER